MGVLESIDRDDLFRKIAAHVFSAVFVGADKVSMAHAGERIELERAFSGATVHDMFNMCLRNGFSI